jgi:hypothetical protein
MQLAPDFCLSLRDPADETNDLGRKGLAIKHLQATLTHSIRNEFYKRLLRNKDPSLLHPLVTPVYGLTINERKMLRERGLKVSKNLDSRLAEKAKQIREASTGTDSASFKPVISSEPLQAAKLDYKSFSDAGDALTSTLGMPSAEEWANKPESEPQEIQYSKAPTDSAETKQTVLGYTRSSTTSTEQEVDVSETKSSASPSVPARAHGVRIEYVAVPFNSEQAVRASEGFVQAREKLMRNGVQLPSIAHVNQEFRSKLASESQRNYESKKRKHDKAMKRFEEAREKMRQNAIARTTVELGDTNAKLEAAPESQTTGPPEAPTEHGETEKGGAVKSEGEVTTLSELPIEKVETNVEAVVEPIPAEALDPTPIEVAEPTPVEPAEPGSVEVIEVTPAGSAESTPAEVESQLSEPMETKPEEASQPTPESLVEVKAEETVQATAESAAEAKSEMAEEKKPKEAEEAPKSALGSVMSFMGMGKK